MTLFDIRSNIEQNRLRKCISLGQTAMAFAEHIEKRVNLEYSNITDGLGNVKQYWRTSNGLKSSYSQPLTDLIVPNTSFTSALKVKVDLMSNMVDAEDHPIVLRECFVDLCTYGFAVLVDGVRVDPVNYIKIDREWFCMIDNKKAYSLDSGMLFEWIDEFGEPVHIGYHEVLEQIIESPILDTELTDDVIHIIREIATGDTLVSSVLQKVANPILLVSDDIRTIGPDGRPTIEIDGRKVIIQEDSRVEVVDRPTKTDEWLAVKGQLQKELNIALGVNDFILGVSESNYNASGVAFKLAFFRIINDINSKLKTLKEFFEFNVLDSFASFNEKEQLEIAKLKKELEV